MDPTFVDLERGKLLHRIYAPKPHGTRSLTFRAYGPLNRFDHHIATANGQPQHSQGLGVLYAARGLPCAVGEFFADSQEITTDGARVATIYATERLVLLDLRGTAATGVGTTQAIGSISQRSTTQAWARYFYRHPALTAVHGLLYTASNTGHDAIAFSERAKGKLERRTSLELGDPVIADELELAADKLHWTIARP